MTKPLFVIAAAVVGLQLLRAVPTAAAQDFEDFTCPPPQSEAEKNLLLRDINDLGDVSKTDPGIIHDELVIAKNKMRCYQKRHKIDLDAFEKNKADFRNKVDAVLKLEPSCGKNAAQVKEILSNLTNSLGPIPGFPIPGYERTANEIQHLLQLPSQELCKNLRIRAAALITVHDDDVAQNLKNANQQFGYGQEVGQAYQERYHALREMSTVWSQETFQRLIAILVILAVVLFAAGIFWPAAKLFGPDLTKELIVSGQLIQFPTVMVLLVIVTVLGLAHIIEDKTLGALLGAIAGYVLAQGVGKGASREVSKAGVPEGQKVAAPGVHKAVVPEDQKVVPPEPPVG